MHCIHRLYSCVYIKFFISFHSFLSLFFFFDSIDYSWMAVISVPLKGLSIWLALDNLAAKFHCFFSLLKYLIQFELNFSNDGRNSESTFGNIGCSDVTKNARNLGCLEDDGHPQSGDLHQIIKINKKRKKKTTVKSVNCFISICWSVWAGVEVNTSSSGPHSDLIFTTLTPPPPSSHSHWPLTFLSTR